MKRCKLIGILLLFAMVSFSGYVYSGNPVSDDLRLRIINTVSYPEEAINAGIEGNVTLLFKFSDSGELRIIQMNSTNKSLENYVRNTLEDATFDEIGIPYNRYFQITLNFSLS